MTRRSTAAGDSDGGGAPTLAALLHARAAEQSGGIRVAGGTGEDAWSWGAVVAEAAVRASLLHTYPLPASRAPSENAEPARQRHVGLLLDNVPDHVWWLLACGLAGDVAVGLNTSRSGPEVARDLAHAEVDLVVTQRRWQHLLTDAEGAAEVVVLVVDDPAYDQLLAGHRDAAPPATTPSQDAIALLLFSSGSTGAPKAIIVSQGRLARLADAIGDRIELTADDVTYLVTPLFHGNAVMMNLVPALARGATVVLRPRFSASAFSDDVHAHGVTFLNYVGRVLSYVLTRPEDSRDRSSTLRLAYGTEASPTDRRRFAERFGCTVQEGYGLSEGVFRINRTPDTPDGSLGVPVGGADVRVLDEATGRECPRAEFDEQGRLRNPEAVGQLVAVGGAVAFEGYWRNPEATAERVRGEDFWSGDLAYRDGEGWFWFAGRGADWFRVDGENVSAAPLERLLAEVPGVAAAAVYAVPDPRTGDAVMAALEPEPGEQVDPDAVASHLADQPGMGAKWWPRFLRVVSSLPVTGSQKVDKQPLRRAAWATDDPVWQRQGRTGAYALLDAGARLALEAEFREHGRAAFLP